MANHRQKWLSRNETFRAATNSYDGGTVESLKQSVQQAADALRAGTCFLALDRRVIQLLESAETETQANEAISLVYDFADEYRVWMGF